MGHVEFGVLSKNCRNFGICKIIPMNGNGDNPLERITAIVTVFDKKTVELIFLKNTITKESYDTYFSRGKFLVQEDYVFSGNNSSFKIKRGEYQVIFDRSFFRVFFS